MWPKKRPSRLIYIKSIYRLRLSLTFPKLTATKKRSRPIDSIFSCRLLQKFTAKTATFSKLYGSHFKQGNPSRELTTFFLYTPFSTFQMRNAAIKLTRTCVEKNLQADKKDRRTRKEE